MKVLYNVIFIGLVSLNLQVACTQDSLFTLKLSKDTILAGNFLELKFEWSNISGEYEGPDLSVFDVVSGPNISTSMQIINGDFSQKSSYSYVLRTKASGEYSIGPAYLYTETETFETTPRIIVVLENPEGIVEDLPRSSGNSNLLLPPPRKKNTKKKRKKI